jgi:hypothetical protein
MDKTALTNDRRDLLGRSITSWLYKPSRSNKFILAALATIGALVIFTIFYGEQLLPKWIKHLPQIFVYFALFLLGPLLKYLRAMGGDQEWTLYDNGFVVATVGKGHERSERIGFWRDYSGCTYSGTVIKLFPKGAARRGVKIPTMGNVTEVYSITRERISMAQAFELDKASRAPERPKSKEQQRLSRIEKKSAQRFSRESKGEKTSKMKTLFGDWDFSQFDQGDQS